MDLLVGGDSIDTFRFLSDNDRGDYIDYIEDDLREGDGRCSGRWQGC